MKKPNIYNSEFKVVEKSKWFFLASAIFIVIGLLVLCIFGLNLGIDFSGGSVLDVGVGSYLNDSNYNDYYDKYKNAVLEILDEEGIVVSTFQENTSVDNPGFKIKYQNKVNGVSKNDAEMNEVNASVKSKVSLAVTEIMREFDDTPSKLNSELSVNLEFTGATASNELTVNAFLSILVASIAILIYVAFRFELISGLSAIVALMHDVLVMIAFVAIVRLQINASFIAAIITIVGYSINNTIILFDRVRENKKLLGSDSDPAKLVNLSIKETFVRSINTTITTLISIVLLAIIGVSAVQEFVLPIIIGLLAGTYSSIFIAPALWAILRKAINKRKKNKKKTYELSE